MNTQTKLTKRGFSLIELMVVIAIVALLAAVAAPAYKSYISKSKMGEVMGFINQQMEAWSENHSLSQTGSATGNLGKYIVSITPSSTGFEVLMVSQFTAAGNLEILGDPFSAVPVRVTYTANASDASVDTTHKWSCVITTPNAGQDRVDIIASYFDNCT